MKPLSSVIINSYSTFKCQSFRIIIHLVYKLLRENLNGGKETLLSKGHQERLWLRAGSEARTFLICIQPTKPHTLVSRNRATDFNGIWDFAQNVLNALAKNVA